MKRQVVLNIGVLLAFAAGAQAQTEEPKCALETLKGAYGVLLTGTGPAAAVAPGQAGFVGQIQQVVGIVVLVYDGKGNFTQVDNVKGTVSGLVPDRPGKGTYTVNPDCTTTGTVNPAPGIFIITKGVIVDGGREFRGFVVTPEANNLTVVGRKIN